MSRQSGAVESCHTQWSVSVIILYKQVRKVNSTLWQCHTTKSYIICKPSEQWTVPQWSLYFCCKKMHLICDAGGGGRGKLLIVQESKVNWKFTFQSNLKKKGKKKKEEKETPWLQDSTEPCVEPKWDRNEGTLTPGHWRNCSTWMDGQVLFTSWDSQSSKTKPWGLTQLQL